MTALENLEFKGIQLSISRLELLLEEMMKQQEKEKSKIVSKFEELPEWITLEQAAALKGGGALNTYKRNARLQPQCGIREGTVSGRKVWRKSTVEEWLNITDDQIDEYEKQVFASYKKSQKVC